MPAATPEFRERKGDRMADRMKNEEMTHDQMTHEDWNEYRGRYEADYDMHYGTTGRPWQDYEPAYRFGHDLGCREEYRNQDWATVEPHARKHWESGDGANGESGGLKGAWEDFKDSVRYAWNEVTGKEHHRRAA